MLKQIITELKNRIRFTDLKQTETVYNGEIRSWGNWIFPDYEDADEEEDFDWLVLSDESCKILDKIVSDFSQKYPEYVVKFQPQEKEWLTVTVEKK